MSYRVIRQFAADDQGQFFPYAIEFKLEGNETVNKNKNLNKLYNDLVEEYGPLGGKWCLSEQADRTYIVSFNEEQWFFWFLMKYAE